MENEDHLMPEESWNVRFFKGKEIREAYEWVFQSDRHIAVHENPPAFSGKGSREAFHIFGSYPDTLKEFGRAAKVYPKQLSVMETHGAKMVDGRMVYHYDDWRRGARAKYEGFL